MDPIEIYCDGGCRGNQFDDNLGSFGIVIKNGNDIHETYGTHLHTTNNRMELTACIEALLIIDGISQPVIVYTDSLYLVKGITEWYPSWIRRGWKNSRGMLIENRDLWEILINLVEDRNDVQFVHVRGHSDNEGNNRADELVNIAMDEYLDSH